MLEHFVLEQNNISWLKIARGLAPLGSLLQRLQVSGTPCYPQILLQAFYQVPSSKCRDLAGVINCSCWKCFERTSYEEMSCSQNKIIIHTGGRQWSERTRVENRLSLSQDSSQLLKGEDVRAHHLPEQRLHCFDTSLPETAKVGCSGLYKVPLDQGGCGEVREFG